MAFRFNFFNPLFPQVDTTAGTKKGMFDKNKIREDVFNQENLELFKTYFEHIKFNEKLNLNTCSAYKYDIYAWFDYILMYQGNKHLRYIEKDDIIEYLRIAYAEDGSMLRRTKSSILRFLKYLYKTNAIKDNYIIKQLSDTKQIEKE